MITNSDFNFALGLLLNG